MENMILGWQMLWEAMGFWEQLLVVLLAGSCLGSFLNVCAIRLPEGRNILWAHSACPRCDHGIRPWHNIPIFGWLMLRGKCYDCGNPIPKRYVIVESLAAGWWLVVFLTLGLSYIGLFMAGIGTSALCLTLIVHDGKSLPMWPTLGWTIVNSLLGFLISPVWVVGSMVGAVIGILVSYILRKCGGASNTYKNLWPIAFGQLALIGPMLVAGLVIGLGAQQYPKEGSRDRYLNIGLIAALWASILISLWIVAK